MREKLAAVLPVSASHTPALQRAPIPQPATRPNPPNHAPGSATIAGCYHRRGVFRYSVLLLDKILLVLYT